MTKSFWQLVIPALLYTFQLFFLAVTLTKHENLPSSYYLVDIKELLLTGAFHLLFNTEFKHSFIMQSGNVEF